jgi:PfpI family intracellular protease
MTRRLPAIILAAVIAASAACAAPVQQQEEKKLEGRKVLMVIASSNFRDEEYSIPRAAMENEGAKITVACSSLKESVGMLKKEKVKPDILITRVKVDSYDAIVFIGGSGAQEYFKSKTALKLAAEGYKKKKIVAAICIAPSILANAGVLKGKKATVYQNQAANLKKQGANYTGSAVEVDGSIITANGPQAAQAFAKELVKALADFKILTGKKIVMIIAPDKFRDEELSKPKKHFTELGAEVTVASTKKTTCKGMLGAEVKPDTTISKVKAADYDVVIFVGGSGARTFFNDRKVQKIAKDAVKKKKVVGAICVAPSILANAGLLKDKEATAYKSEKDNLEKRGAKFKEEDVVSDGKIVTANGPEASEEFAKEIVKKLRED